jgi:hypothetical protein
MIIKNIQPIRHTYQLTTVPQGLPEARDGLHSPHPCKLDTGNPCGMTLFSFN